MTAALVIALGAAAVSAAVLIGQRRAAPGPSAPRAGSQPARRSPAQPAPGGQSPRIRLSLDRGWRFALGHASDVARDFGFGGGESYAKITSWRGAVRPDFNDAAWRELDLPHDWVPELPFVQEPASEVLVSHGFKPVGRAFPDTSIGWYRKRFPVAPDAASSNRFAIELDGAYRDCHVWLNGILLGRHEGGYSPFDFDATDFIRPGENVLVVRVDATQAEGWFYEGAGIYRHVWLVETSPVHVPRWGVFVSPVVTGQSATVKIATAVVNESDRSQRVEVASRIVDPAGTTVASIAHPPLTVATWGTARMDQTTPLAPVTLWSLERPALYRLITTVAANGRVLDRVETRFGLRTIRFDADRGFFLNGRRVQINGVCNHQDHAGVGAAIPDRLQRYRLERLKEMGVNAYRSSHNPPAPELLDACDEMGILVMDETRLFNANEAALAQLGDLVRRDRNHPSVILWSIGNEEPEQATPRGNRVAKTMVRVVKALDATRPVTYASNSGAFAGVNEVVDVRGFNYYVGEIDRYHREHPGQPLLGSEIASTLCTRGEHAVDPARGYMSAYDKAKPRWGELAEEWMTFYMARPWLAGAFVWTGFDYRGEPTPYEWPCINSPFGILDTCGFPKDLFWYYKSWWTGGDVLHLLPHWTWPGRDGQAIEVWAFTNLEEVRLSLNGRDLGARKVQRLGHAEWQVPYEPGRLEAIGYRGGREVSRTTVQTTGDAARVALSADRGQLAADGRDVSVVTVSAIDAQGRAVPVAAHDVTLEISGPGRIIGVGNGDPSSHEADTFVRVPIVQDLDRWKTLPLDAVPQQAPSAAALDARGGRPARVDRAASGMRPNTTQAFWSVFDVAPDRLTAKATLGVNGLAQVLVQSTGEPGDITLGARAKGLEPAMVVITASVVAGPVSR
jgi:beta-galactosidase